MLTVHIAQVTNPNETGMNTSTELAPELIVALTARDVDLGEVEVSPDRAITVPTDGGHIFISEDEEGWIAALLVENDSEMMIYEGRMINGLADVIATYATPQ